MTDKDERWRMDDSKLEIHDERWGAVTNFTCNWTIEQGYIGFELIYSDRQPRLTSQGRRGNFELS